MIRALVLAAGIGATMALAIPDTAQILAERPAQIDAVLAAAEGR